MVFSVNALAGGARSVLSVDASSEALAICRANVALLSSLDPRAGAALAKSLPDSPDRSVRGGSWADQPGTDKVYTRGAQPADWCTPYLGFRVALARQ